MPLQVTTSTRLLGALLAGVTALSTAATEPAPAAAPTPEAAPAAASVHEPVAAPTPATAPVAPPPLLAAPASTVDDQARFLAGLPVPAGSPLAAWQATQDYRDHFNLMNAEWKKLTDRLDKATAWQQAELAPRIQGNRNLIYFFGGPDAVHAVRLFPDAPVYLLAGLEPVGVVEPPEKMKFSEVHTAIDGLSYGLRTFVSRSFFRTTEMGKDLQGRGIKGVLPVLYLMLSRSGATIDATTFFEVDARGVVAERPAAQKWGAGVPGVKVTFHFDGRPRQEMLYVRVNLYNDELDKQPGFMTWARSFGAANSFLKAASFILHDDHFSRTRSLLLEASAAVIEEDSGIPYRAFGKGEWDFTCFGKYMAPRDPFEKQYQKDLDKACGELPFHPLPFIIGYRRPVDTFLLVAVKKPPAAAAVPAPEPPPAATPVHPAPVHPAPVHPAPAATNEVPAPAPSPTPADPPTR
jgi:hypothetical protein